MSFLAGRQAGKEAAFFFQESKHAVNRLAEKTPKNLPPSSAEQQPPQADVLPEVLRHSLPPKMFGGGQPSPSDPPSSTARASKWALHPQPNNASISSPDALNPLRAYLSLPQVTFGPKRWELPSTEHSVMASTANELRTDKHTPINPNKLKAAAEGLQQIGKAFAVATAIVFGGAALVFGMATSKLEMHNSDDIRIKGKDLVHPKFEKIREQLYPIRTWAENMSKKWHLEREETIREKPIIKELSKILGAKTSD